MVEFNVGDIAATTDFSAKWDVLGVNRNMLTLRAHGKNDARVWTGQPADAFVKYVKPAPSTPKGFVSVEAVEAEIKRVAAANGWCVDGQNETRKRLGLNVQPVFSARMVIEFTANNDGKNLLNPEAQEKIVKILNESSTVGRTYRFKEQGYI